MNFSSSLKFGYKLFVVVLKNYIWCYFSGLGDKGEKKIERKDSMGICVNFFKYFLKW